MQISVKYSKYNQNTNNLWYDKNNSLHFVDPSHSRDDDVWMHLSDLQLNRELNKLQAATCWLPTDAALRHSAPPKEQK